MKVTEIIKRGLIVSCQALSDEPLHSSYIMSKMALAAYQGGAIAIRANSYADIIAIKQEVDIPIIGIIKKDYPDSPIYITPTIKEIDEVFRAGAHVVALDATSRKRPNNDSLDDLIKNIKKQYPSLFLMADVSTIEEAIYAEKLGFDLVSTTLNGYTENTKDNEIPDFELLEKMVMTLNIPVIAEGGYITPEQFSIALNKGAYSVVVGTAITRPREITRRFVDKLKLA